MARHYSPKAFMIEAPNRLLREYLDQINVGAGIPWDYLSERDIDRVFEVYQNAPEKLRRQMDENFRAVAEMADEGGTKVLLDVGQSQFHDVDLLTVFEQSEGHLARAFEAFLRHREIFDQASIFHGADNLGNWRKRKRLPRMLKQPDDESRLRLAGTISEYYRNKEGRGHACQVEYYKRDARHYWFAHTEDYAISQLIYDEQHHLDRQTQRPAFLIIFVYSEEEFSLDVYAKGNKETLSDLQTIFGRAVLECELGDPPADSVVYELDSLRDRNFQFSVEPEDQVSEVRVKRLKLRLMGGNERITIETAARRDPKEIYDLLERVLRGIDVSADMVKVASVGLQLIFVQAGDKREKALTFNVSHPNSCSLKSDPRHEVAKTLLIRWGLDVSGRAEDNPPEPGEPAQRIIRV